MGFLISFLKEVKEENMSKKLDEIGRPLNTSEKF